MRVDLKMDKEIGKGSFGKVSIARWRGLTVAVKELKGNSEIGFHTTTPEILKNLQKVRSCYCNVQYTISQMQSQTACLQNSPIVLLCMQPVPTTTVEHSIWKHITWQLAAVCLIDHDMVPRGHHLSDPGGSWLGGLLDRVSVTCRRPA